MKLPECCLDCTHIAIRDNLDAWPYVCGLDETEITNFDKRPDDCPLIELGEALYEEERSNNGKL